MLASLIGSHFPSFDFFQPADNPLDETISASKSSADARPPESKHLSDHGLDFLVAILGLLVNLVEKDNQNRSILLLSLSPASVHDVPPPKLLTLRPGRVHARILSSLRA